MGKVFDEIGDDLAAFIARQQMFFVATAPLAADGHVNLSPKGLDSFRVLDPRNVAYLDLTGSGVETISHVRENGRVTLMFCAFEGSPKIVRLYGQGEVVRPGDAGFDALRGLFPGFDGVRAVIRVRVDRVADSCGYAVPRYRFEEQRRQLTEWVDRKGDEGVRRYQREKNRVSIDGLPALDEER